VPDQRAGTLLFVLHSHLPYVLYHGRWPHGTDWLCEAAAETYIPLLDELNRLQDAGIAANITIGITPVLAEQLAHPMFPHEFITYLQEKIDASYVDEEYFRHVGDLDLARLTAYWRDWYGRAHDRFTRVYNRDILGAFRKLQDSGAIEIITSSATHGYSPLLGYDSTIQAQVKQGVQAYQRHFGRKPAGYWLPECAYRPRYRWSYPVQPRGSHLEPYERKGVEEFLSENGLKYFLVESHLLRGGAPAESVYSERGPRPMAAATPAGPAGGGTADLYQPHGVWSQAEGPQVAVFGRDDQTGGQVWSAAQGYPGDPNYLDFHKKRLPGSHRYWRVTGPAVDMSEKQIYDPAVAASRVEEHARHFVKIVREVLKDYRGRTGHPGVVCSPYDTELFGHWWFEGVSWLGKVIEILNADPEVSLSTGSACLAQFPPQDTIRLPEGSWGQGGFHHMWLNHDTAWSWELVYEAEARMNTLAVRYADRADLQPLLKQLARELFLLSSSDWQFNISTESSRDYGQMRLKEHHRSFCRLADMLEKKARGEEPTHEEWCFLGYTEERDSIFQDVDPSWFGCLEHPVESNAPSAAPDEAPTGDIR